ncbi:MAG: hypothetical protein NC223_08230 [Butyrivibrio sp.]|nr:hypothetical protein [Butyrivibrio sp.]
MKILYGTTNRAKLEYMRRATDSLGLEIVSLRDLGLPLPKIDEIGKNPLENAEIKARAYFEAFSMPVFSLDSGLYFDNLEEKLQPGTHVRRVNGRELDDAEMTEYYSDLAKRHGGSLIGRYRNAICFIADKASRFSRMDASLESRPFMLVAVPHPKRVEGFPLDSLSVDIASGKYYYDLNNESDDDLYVMRGLRAFWESVRDVQGGE